MEQDKGLSKRRKSRLHTGLDKRLPKGRKSTTSSTGGANLDHLYLRVEPFDAAEIARHLAVQNVACGADTLRYGAEGEGPSIYLRDPEGNGIELKGPPTDR